MLKKLMMTSAIVSFAVIGLGGSGGMAQETDQPSMKPKSNWTINKIDTPDAESYCTLARQYEEGIVFTLGRNMAEEYSLAIDFQNEKLDVNKAYSLSLQPGPGQIRAYEMMPASQQAMVVRLGWDESFFKALQKSNNLKAEIDGKKYNFDLVDFTKGNDDLNSCMTALKDKTETTVAQNGEPQDQATAPEEAKGFSAQKIENTSTEVAQADKQDMPSENETLQTADVPQSTVAEIPEQTAVAEESEKSFFEKIADKISPPSSEGSGEAVSEDVMDVAAAAPQQEMIIPPAEIVETQEEVSVMDNDASPVVNIQEPNMEASVVDQAAEEAADAADIHQPTPVVPTAVADQQAEIQESLNAEREQAAQQLKEIEAAKIAAQTEALSLQEKLALYEQKIQALESENKKYYEDAKMAVSQIDNAKIEAGTQGLEKAKDFESKLEAATSDNIRLKAEIEELRLASENALLSGTGTDFNLEKVTQRYNESQREVQRLGALLESQRQSNQQEIKKLESMLFDPKVAENSQIQRLSDLESKLADAEKKLNSPENEEKIKALTDSLKVEQDKAIEGQKQLEQKEALLKDLREQIAAIEAKTTTEKSSLGQKDQEIEALKLQVAEAQKKVINIEAATAQKESGVDTIKVSLQEKEAKISEQGLKITELQAQIASKDKVAETIPAALQEKETALALVKTELDIEQQKAKAISAKLVEQDLKIAQMEASMASKQAMESSGDQKVQEQLKFEQEKSAKISTKLIEQDTLIQKLQSQLVTAQAQSNAVLPDTLKQNQMTKEIADLNTVMAVKEQLIKDAAMDSVKKDAEIAALSAQLSGKNAQTMSSAGDVSKLNSEISVLKSTMTNKDAELLAIKNSLANKEVEISNLAKVINEKDKRISSLASQPAAVPLDRIVKAEDLPKPSAAAPASIAPGAAPSFERLSPAVSSPSPSAAPAAVMPSIGQADIQNVLQRAGVSAGSIRMEKQPGDLYQYRWNTPKLSGVAQVIDQGKAGSLSQFSQNYIDDQKERCDGDFASVNGEQGSGFSTMEIACVDTNSSMSSSVVFFEKKGSVGVIAHQTSAEDMDVAMDARDKIAKQMGDL